MDDNLVPVSTAAELRDILGPISERARTKTRSTLHNIDRQWLAASPFCLMATSAANGSCDVSPKGDPTGIPSRPCIAKSVERTESSLEELEVYYGDQYRLGLYGESG